MRGLLGVWLLAGCYEQQISSMDQQIGALRATLSQVQSQQAATQQALEAVATLPVQLDALTRAQQQTAQEVLTLQVQVKDLPQMQSTLADAHAQLALQEESLAALGARLDHLEADQREARGQPQLAALGGLLVLCPLVPLLWLRTRD